MPRLFSASQWCTFVYLLDNYDFRLDLPVNVVPKSIDTIKSGFSAMFTCNDKLEARLMQEPSKNKTKKKGRLKRVDAELLTEQAFPSQPRFSNPVLSRVQYAASCVMVIWLASVAQ